MSMARCRECGGEVSSEAVVCPHCGIRDPATAVAPADARVHERDRVHEHDRAAGVRAHPAEAHPIVRRRGGKGGWMVALLLLLVLAALFGLWYSDIVNFN